MLAFYELVLVTAVFHLLTLGMEVWAGTFFDDFPILSKSASAGQTEQHVSHLLNLIGLRFSAEGKKRLPFDMSMAVLGVVLDLSRFAEGVVSFKHTQPRRTHPGGAESLRGRLIWFEGDSIWPNCKFVFARDWEASHEDGISFLQGSHCERQAHRNHQSSWQDCVHFHGWCIRTNITNSGNFWEASSTMNVVRPRISSARLFLAK